ncbi:hypothetical protein KJ640_03625, partial [bacterium]|nr:hypothetical protein [bacterium]
MILCLLCASSVNSFSATFTLKEEAEVAGKEILLSDITEYAGPKIKIGVAPLLGRSRILKGQYVELVAKRRIPEIEIIGDEVRVTRACQALPKEKITEEIVKEITKAIPEKVEVIVEKIPEIILGKGELSFEVEPIIKADTAICKVQILVNGEESKRIRVGCRIKRFGDVVVAKKDISAGSLIKADDIEVAHREIKKDVRFSEPVGKETRV